MSCSDYSFIGLGDFFVFFSEKKFFVLFTLKLAVSFDLVLSSSSLLKKYDVNSKNINGVQTRVWRANTCMACKHEVKFQKWVFFFKISSGIKNLPIHPVFSVLGLLNEIGA